MPTPPVGPASVLPRAWYGPMTVHGLSVSPSMTIGLPLLMAALSALAPSHWTRHGKWLATLASVTNVPSGPNHAVSRLFQLHLSLEWSTTMNPVMLSNAVARASFDVW